VTLSKFPVDAPKNRVLKALRLLGFRLIREKEHISMERTNSEGTKNPLTMPNHLKIKASTLRTICTQASVHGMNFLMLMKKLDGPIQITTAKTKGAAPDMGRILDSGPDEHQAEPYDVRLPILAELNCQPKRH